MRIFRNNDDNGICCCIYLFIFFRVRIFNGSFCVRIDNDVSQRTMFLYCKSKWTYKYPHRKRERKSEKNKNENTLDSMRIHCGPVVMPHSHCSNSLQWTTNSIIKGFLPIQRNLFKRFNILYWQMLTQHNITFKSSCPSIFHWNRARVRKHPLRTCLSLFWSAFSIHTCKSLRSLS